MSNELEHVVAKIRVAHVTFYVTPHPDFSETFNIYSSKRDGKPEWIEVATSFNEANQIVAEEIKKLEAYLENKRDKSPTSKQIMFLFREKIPIPVDLTWGQASDLIDEKLNEKKAKRFEKFRGLEVGMRVTYGKFTGTIEKLTSNNQGSNCAYVKFDDNGTIYQCPIPELKKIEEETKP